MLAATYAKRVGRGVAFSLAAFRQAFAGGRDIGDENTVLIAGAACEMHPVALTKGIELRSTAQALQAAGERALKRRCAIPAGDPDGRQDVRRPGGDGSRRRAMKANRLYHLIVSREGREPAFLSDPDRTDRIEVVSVDDGEVILYWDVDPKQASSCSSCCAPTSPASTPRSSSTSGSTRTPRTTETRCHRAKPLS